MGNSFQIHALGQKNRGMLELAKLGQLKMAMPRQISGTPKTAIVKRTPTGKWFVHITVELHAKHLQEKPVPPSQQELGIDVGLFTFAYLSTGEAIANPRFFREQEASKLVARFSFIAVEALVVRNMVKNPRLSKSIADASWSMFFTRLAVKAEEAGRQLVKVNPAYTSQTCSACGHRQPMPLSVRVYECPHCGLVIHRDHNGSLNILADALEAVGRHSRVIPEAPGLQPWGVVTNSPSNPPINAKGLNYLFVFLRR